MIRVPTWLFILAISSVFLGSCTLSLRPVWSWIERGAIRPVKDDKVKYFPVLAHSPDGRYFVANLGDQSEEEQFVKSIENINESMINRDLCKSIGWDGYYPYFQILSKSAGVFHVSLEMPTLRDSKRKGWYFIQDGKILPERILSYGPGFAFLVMPCTFLVGLGGVMIFSLFVRRKKSNKPVQPTSLRSAADR